MLKKQSELFLIAHQIIDLFIVVACFYGAYHTKLSNPDYFGGLTSNYNYDFAAALSIISFHISLRLFGVYSQYRQQSFKNILSRLLKAVLTGVSGIVFLGYILHFDSVSRLLIAIFTIYCFLALAAFKAIVYEVLSHGRTQNFNTRSILVIGSRQRSLDFIKKVSRRKDSGYRIRGVLETSDQSYLVGDRVFNSIKIIGTLNDFKTILKAKTIDEVVFGLPLKEIQDVHHYIYFAEEMGINIRILPDFQIETIKYYPQTATVEIEDFLGIPTLALSSAPKNSKELIIKALVDFTGALLGVVLLFPLFLFIGLAIKLSSKGPVLYSQERSGLNGRRFMVHKFRTMVVNAETLRGELLENNEMDGPVFKIKNDPRITWIGHILRKTSLDELPQLFNVLKGEMSLVGPRPPIPSEVEQYKLWQRRRLSMKPGMTCIWQVSGRNEVSFEEWMNMDLIYIDNWSLLLDFKLLLMTVKEVAFGGGR